MKFLLLAGFCLALPCLQAADTATLVTPANRINPDDPAWQELAATLARPQDATADFSEQRFFPFRKAPVELKGESRLSLGRGLSLHYTAPEERTVILDTQGVLIRDTRGQTAAPADPQAAAANAALVRVLRFDLPALAGSFELYGRRGPSAWTLAFVPRAADLRRTVGTITLAGNPANLERIEIRRSANQYVVIVLAAPRLTPFAPGDLQRYFR